MKTVNFGVIGGGSIFSPELVALITKDIDSFGSIHIKFMDIDKERQGVVGALCERIVKKSGAAVTICYVDSYEEAIVGSDYILVQFRVGGEDMRIEDELLGKKYKIPFVETISVCGVSTFLRSYYEIEKIAKIITEKNPDAWVLNFANPAGLLAEALSRLGVKHVLGVCNASTRLLQFLKTKLDFTDDDEFLMSWRGLNHLSVVDSFMLRGREMMPELLAKLTDYESDRVPFPAELCRGLGYLPNQYFQYYYLERDIIAKEQAAEKTRSQLVKEINATLLKQYETIDEVPEDLTRRGGSGYSKTVMEVILALQNGGNRVHYIVTQNRGAMTELPFESYVEVPCMVGTNRVTPLACEKLPPAAAALISTMKAFETELIAAAMERNPDRLYRSMMMHPLIGSHSLAKPLMADILAENAAYLPPDIR